MPTQFVLRSLGTPILQFAIAGKERLFLGRSHQCDLVVPHTSVSRRHARVCICEGGLQIVDLQSLNGVYVGGQRVREAALTDGEEVRFGAVPFQLHDAENLREDALEIKTTPFSSEQGPGELEVVPNPEALTAAQRRVFDHVLRGEPEKLIARRLDISRHTVHNHVRSIFRSFGVHSKIELIGKFVSKTCH
jgi:DNA-binding CsgD family transcriptional regulator